MIEDVSARLPKVEPIRILRSTRTWPKSAKESHMGHDETAIAGESEDGHGGPEKAAPCAPTALRQGWVGH